MRRTGILLLSCLFVVVYFYCSEQVSTFGYLQEKKAIFRKCLRVKKDLNGLVWFCGISTIVGYLRLNPVFKYILNI